MVSLWLWTKGLCCTKATFKILWLLHWFAEIVIKTPEQLHSEAFATRYLRVPEIREVTAKRSDNIN